MSKCAINAIKAGSVERARAARSEEAFEHFKFTLGFLFRKDGTTLLKKAIRGTSIGKLNGPGGKFNEQAEELTACFKRETLEETNLAVKSLVYHGAKHVSYDMPVKLIETVHIFSCREFEGKERFSDEGRFTWVRPTQDVLHKCGPTQAIGLGRCLKGDRSGRILHSFMMQKRLGFYAALG